MPSTAKVVNVNNPQPIFAGAAFFAIGSVWPWVFPNVGPALHAGPGYP
jgi:hypothetical protein